MTVYWTGETDREPPSDDELLGRAVKSARANYNKRFKHPRWVAVQDVFALGSNYSIMLCRRFGLDPDEQVWRQ